MATITETKPTLWQIDASHTAVEFAVKHMMFTTVKGRFAGVTGTITEHPDHSLSGVEVEIDAASVDTRDEKRDAHLRSADFLDVETFPTLRFTSTKVVKNGDDALLVTGDLTIHGVTHSVVLEASLTGRGTSPWGQQVAGFSAETTINRKDFGLQWNVALETGGVLVGEKIKISIEVEATLAQ